MKDAYRIKDGNGKFYRGEENGGGKKDMTAAAYEVIKGKVSGIREAEPDDPIYTRGFIIGGTFSRMSSKSNVERKYRGRTFVIEGKA